MQLTRNNLSCVLILLGLTMTLSMATESSSSRELDSYFGSGDIIKKVASTVA